jgi:hypothetical protein
MLYKAPQYDPDERGMTAKDVQELRAMAEGHPFVIVVGGRRRGADLDAERVHLAAVAEAGADWWMEWVPPGDRRTMREAVERGPLRL